MTTRLRWLTLMLAALVAAATITVDAAGITRISFGASLPTNCVSGNIHIKTAATTGLYWCSTPGSPGTWTAVGFATSGTSLLYGNGSGGTSNATVGSGLSFTGGTLSVSGGGVGVGGVGGVALVESHTASTSAALNFTTCISSTYDEYLIEIVNLVTPAAEYPQFQMSTDGGSTYDSTGVYNDMAGYSQFSVSNATGNGQNSVGGMRFTPMANVTLNANGSWNASLRLMDPGGALYKVMMGQVIWYENSNALATSHWVGLYKSTTPVNAFRMNLVNGGNITSGTARCYGVAK